VRIWVDVANAPHATLFRPVVDELRRRGHAVVVTAWDRGATRALAVRQWPEVTLVGEPGFRTPLLHKATAVWRRARALARLADVAGADLALGHNSYSQLVAARLVGVPSLTMMDYEHQPANHLAFRLASTVLLPDAISPHAVRRFGPIPDRLVHYPGLKEEVTLADFVPDPGFRARLGVGKEPLVVLRPPPQGALYHRHANPLFLELVHRLAAFDATVRVAPRTRQQGQSFGGVAGVRVLEDVVSGPDLLYHADLFVGAGGTMTREAAVLGTRTCSAFAGRPAAVDRELVRCGRLQLLRSAADLPLDEVRRRPAPARLPDPAPVERLVDIVLANAGGAAGAATVTLGGRSDVRDRRAHR
jgi:predicted glycosyltransferase